MGDTTVENPNVLSEELLLGVVALQMSMQKNYYMREHLYKYYVATRI